MAERLLHAMTVLLVVGVAGLAFVVSFEAISAFAVATGRIPDLPWLVRPAAGRHLHRRRHPGDLVAVAGRSWRRLHPHAGGRGDRGVAGAECRPRPDRLAARLVAALPPLALLAAAELVMSEASRALAHPGAAGRVGASSLPAATASAAVLVAPANAMTASAGARTAPASAVTGAAAAGDSRTRVRGLLAGELAGGPRLTGTQVAAVVGIKPRRAQELLRELRAPQAASTAAEQHHPASDAGAP